MRVLLLSNSTNHGAPFLAHARERIAEFARGEPVSFVPFALADWDGYTERVRDALGLDVVGVHRGGHPARAIAEARCLFVGGGNTFRLLDALYRLGVLDVVRRRVRSGELAYAGDPARQDIVKVAVLTGSLLAAVLAATLLRIRNRHYRLVHELETADRDHDGVPDVYLAPQDATGPNA